jgi:hypothetical protein
MGDDHAGHDHSIIKSYYTCSMHPQVKQDGPGKCPICHMNLTKVEVDEADSTPVKVEKKVMWQCKDFPDVTSEVEDVCPMDGTPMVKVDDSLDVAKIIGKVKLRKSQMRHFNPDYFPATKMKMVKKIRLLGSVLQSEEKESKIPARIGGRVEKVYVKSSGSFININDPVVDIYSPKLITAGEEYLIARESYEKDSANEFKELLKKSKERLRLWGVRSFQYENWYKNKKVPRNITIYSPSTGVVRRKNAIIGKYFKEGENFLELTDLSDVWVEMDVYEHDAALVKLGQEVKLEFTAFPGKSMSEKIDFIAPVLSPKSRTLKIRTTIKNPTGKIRPGMVADATLTLEIEGMPLVIPRTAIIDTGKRKVVWVKVASRQFQAKEIVTGHESEGYVEVIKGVMENEEVIIEGNFLLDAQAQLFGGYEDAMEQKSSGHHHHH